MVTVLEDRAVTGRAARVVVAPAALRARTGAPDALVEDDVVHVQAHGVRHEVRRDRPALAAVRTRDRPDEDVDGTPLVVRRALDVAGGDASRGVAAEGERSEGAHEVATHRVRAAGEPVAPRVLGREAP